MSLKWNPDTKGGVFDFQSLSDSIHGQGGTFSVATDLLALTVLKAPGEFGADIAGQGRNVVHRLAGECFAQVSEVAGIQEWSDFNRTLFH